MQRAILSWLDELELPQPLLDSFSTLLSEELGATRPAELALLGRLEQEALVRRLPLAKQQHFRGMLLRQATGLDESLLALFDEVNMCLHASC